MPLLRSHPREVYSLLLRAAADTILTFSRNNRGMLPGILAVLHTWGQTLIHHSHAHLLVTSGGLSLDQNRWVSLKSNYLFPVRALSRVFRAKMLEALYERDFIDPSLYRRLKAKEWVVFCEGSDSSADKLLLYLGRYIYRVAIDDLRIRSIDPVEQTGTFSYKDYSQNGRSRLMTLPAFTFIARFLQHILPHGFMKIRYYGLYAHTRKNQLPPRCRELLRSQSLHLRQTLLCLQTLIETINLPASDSLSALRQRCHPHLRIHTPYDHSSS